MDEKLRELRDKLWDYAETGFTEYKSAKAMVELLESEGFKVNTGISNMPTSYEGVYGQGKPCICFLAEYDALFGMNQQADLVEYQPITSSDDTGHGCGHHLLGTGSIKAAIEFKNYLAKNNLQGTCKIVGCPAEESGSGKAYLARDGYFKDADIVLTWHPSNYNQVVTGSSQSCISCFFKFTGVSSHAASAPYLGRSALDACELMNVGVNYLREHMESSDRVHYAYIDAGGKAPNVVQSKAILKYFVRSTTNTKCEDLYKRVKNIALGAALMTDTKVDIIFDEGLSNTIPNYTIEEVLKNSFQKLYKNDYTPSQLAYLEGFKKTFSVADAIKDLPKFAMDKKKVIDNITNCVVNDYFIETKHSDECDMGSTDVGDVSWVVPTAQINTACFSIGAGAHSWQWVAQGKSDTAFKGAMLAGNILCDSAIEFYKHPELIKKAQAEFKERLGKETYKCLIPDDVKPHISTIE